MAALEDWNASIPDGTPVRERISPVDERITTTPKKGEPVPISNPFVLE